LENYTSFEAPHYAVFSNLLHKNSIENLVGNNLNKLQWP